MKTYEQVFEEFWKDIVCNKDGSLDVDQIKKELYDFYTMMEEVPKVYCHITGEKIGKPLTKAEHVIAIADERIDELCREYAEEVLQEYKDGFDPKE